jgi:hypothetical protein
MGDRLAFTNGMILLAVAAGLIFVAFAGRTAPLIPLFAVGVFLAFTMSQAGMVVHWLRGRDAHWRRSLCFNAVGGALSAIVFVTAAITKFTAGAWVAVAAIGIFVLLALRIRRHYDRAGEAIALHPDLVELPAHPVVPHAVVSYAGTGAETETEENPQQVHHLVIVPLASLDLPSMRALAYAASLQQPVLALHVSPSEDEAERFGDYWREWGDHLPLEIVVSPYRAIVAPLINYIESLHAQRPDLTLTVIVPEIVVRHRVHRVLHNETAGRLRRALRTLPKIVVTTIPFHLPL